MNIIKKIFAYFTIKGEKKQMELAAAEIRQKGAFLHPAVDPEHTFYVNFDSVDIVINPEGELQEDNIRVVDRKTVTREQNETPNITKSSTTRKKIWTFFRSVVYARKTPIHNNGLSRRI